MSGVFSEEVKPLGFFLGVHVVVSEQGFLTIPDDLQISLVGREIGLRAPTFGEQRLYPVIDLVQHSSLLTQQGLFSTFSGADLILESADLGVVIWRFLANHLFFEVVFQQLNVLGNLSQLAVRCVLVFRSKAAPELGGEIKERWVSTRKRFQLTHDLVNADVLHLHRIVAQRPFSSVSRLSCGPT